MLGRLGGQFQQDGGPLLKFALDFPGKVGLVVNSQTVNQITQAVASIQNISQLLSGNPYPVIYNPDRQSAVNL